MFDNQHRKSLKIRHRIFTLSLAHLSLLGASFGNFLGFVTREAA